MRKPATYSIQQIHKVSSCCSSIRMQVGDSSKKMMVRKKIMRSNRIMNTMNGLNLKISINQ